MNGNRVMLQAAMDGGFRPSKEARDIEAALERRFFEDELKTLADGDLRETTDKGVAAVLDWLDRCDAVLRWFRMQGDG